LIITEAKNGHFFVCKRIEFVYPRLRDFVKLTLTRVIDCDSKNRDRVESLTRFTLSLTRGLLHCLFHMT